LPGASGGENESGVQAGPDPAHDEVMTMVIERNQEIASAFMTDSGTKKIHFAVSPFRHMSR
jgi:hypothetical protein